MTTSSPLRGAIAALLHHPEEGSLDRTLAQSILGTVDVETIAVRVESYLRDAFGCGVRECLFFTQSVSAVWGLVLENGERVVLKSHVIATAPRLRGFGSLGELEAVYEAQARMAEAGFPCAAVVRRPRAWPSGAVAAMSLLPSPRGDDPHEVPTSGRAVGRSTGKRSAGSTPPRSTPSPTAPGASSVYRVSLATRCAARCALRPTLTSADELAAAFLVPAFRQPATAAAPRTPRSRPHLLPAYTRTPPSSGPASPGSSRPRRPEPAWERAARRRRPRP